jgi:hypothetical protein
MTRPSKLAKLSGLTRLAEVTDPDAVVYVTDAFGEPMAAIYVHDLRTWLWAIEAVESWLQRASAATRDDYAEFLAERFGPCDHGDLGDLSWMLSAIRYRIGVVVNEVSS